MVLWLWSCETIRLGIISRGLFSPLILEWGNVSSLYPLDEQLTYQNLFYALVTVPAQGFFMYRIYVLTGRKLWLLIPIIVILGWQFLGTIACVVLAVVAPTYQALINDHRYTDILYAGLGTAFVVDTAISSTLIVFLLRKRTGYYVTDRLVIRLIIFTVTTGSWTALLALGIIIAVAVGPSGLAYVALLFLSSGFYLTSVLASLNSRSWIYEAPSVTGPMHLDQMNRARQSPSQGIHVSHSVIAHGEGSYNSSALEGKAEQTLPPYTGAGLHNSGSAILV